MINKLNLNKTANNILNGHNKKEKKSAVTFKENEDKINLSTKNNTQKNNKHSGIKSIKHKFFNTAKYAATAILLALSTFFFINSNKNNKKDEINENTECDNTTTPEIKEKEIKATESQHRTDISENTKKGVEFGHDLLELIKNDKVNIESIQDLVNKHFEGKNIKILPMNEYIGNGPQALNENKAAVTRPYFDENGTLQSIEVFIPDIDTSDMNTVLEFADKTSHEITHISQYINNTSESEHLLPTKRGKFLNYVQKRITDIMINKLVPDASVGYIKETNTKIQTPDDYNKFMDSEGSVSESKIREYCQLGENEREGIKNINVIFNILYDNVLQSLQYEKDPVITELIQEYGSYENLRNEIKSIAAETFKNEEEAYLTGQIIRQEINETSGKQTYNDLINMIMGMCAKALNSEN